MNWKGFLKSRKGKLIIFLIGIISFLLVYDEYDYINTLNSESSSAVEIGPSCWSYASIMQYGSRFIDKPMSPEVQVVIMRNLTNQNYTLFINSLNSGNVRSYNDVFPTFSLMGSTNMIESNYAVLKEQIPETKPITCIKATAYEDINKAFLASFVYSVNYDAISKHLYYIIKENADLCINKTDYITCMKGWTYLFENESEIIKNTLPRYKEVSFPKCAKTLVYTDLKQAEMETRKQLNDSKDSFSIIWKSIQIGMYDKCSEKIYEDIKYNSCDLTQYSKSMSLNAILDKNGLLSECFQDYLDNETPKLIEKLIAAKNIK